MTVVEKGDNSSDDGLEDRPWMPFGQSAYYRFAVHNTAKDLARTNDEENRSAS